MRLKTLVTTLLAAAILAPGLGAAPSGDGKTWQQAMRLYGNGMYEQARILFASMPDGPLTDAVGRDPGTLRIAVVTNPPFSLYL